MRLCGQGVGLKKKSLWLFLEKCRDCGKTYKSAAGLSRHRAAIHLQKFQHSCKICGMAFVQKSSLLRHQKVHDKTRPFQCGYCIGSFKDKWHLTQHERTHTGAKPYACNICEKSYKLKVELREHICAVHENLERKCPECSYTCKTFGALASHWKLKHASEWFHKNSSKYHNSKCSSEENPSLSIEWRNRHAAQWANPESRKKRERINIPQLEVLAESKGNKNDDSGELAMCDNSGTTETGSLSQDIPGNHLSSNLSSSASSTDEVVTQVCVPSSDKVKEKLKVKEETLHVSTGHCETKVRGVPLASKSMVPQQIELNTVSNISEVSGVKCKKSRGKQNNKKYEKPALNIENKTVSEENTKYQKRDKGEKRKEREPSIDLEMLQSATLT